jgi:hypothetical protein
LGGKCTLFIFIFLKRERERERERREHWLYFLTNQSKAGAMGEIWVALSWGLPIKKERAGDYRIFCAKSKFGEIHKIS